MKEPLVERSRGWFVWAWVGGAILAGLLLSGGGALAQCELFDIDRPPGVSGSFGYDVERVGDVDMDGTPDLAVSGSVSVTLFSGRDGAFITSLAISDQDQQGMRLANAGDVNGDGADDTLVGVPGHSSSGRLKGTVYVFSGLDGSLIDSIDGLADYGRFGWAIGGVGDLNKDGFDDFIVGEPSASIHAPNDGVATIYSGQDRSVLFALVGGSHAYFGSSADAIGDINGDTFTDLIVGAPDSNYASVYSGRDGTLIHKLRGSSGSADAFGTSVLGPGDLNGDGILDVIVGVPWTSVPGTPGDVVVYSTLDWTVIGTWSGVSPEDRFGQGLAKLGDVNADGRPDVAVVGKNDVYAISGADGSTLYTFPGNAAATAGDVNGDGFADIVVGNSSDSKATVYSGQLGSSSAYGNGCPGTGGIVPVLRSSCAFRCGTANLSVEDGRGSAPGALLLSLTGTASTPFFGCTLLVDSPVLVANFTLGGLPGLGGDGSVQLPLPVPCSAPAGIKVYAQAGLIDWAGPKGVVMTNGLEVTVY